MGRIPRCQAAVGSEVTGASCQPPSKAHPGQDTGWTRRGTAAQTTAVVTASAAQGVSWRV
jgi:hypothetical protein